MGLNDETESNPCNNNASGLSNVHAHADMATISKEVIQQLKSANQKETSAEDGFDQYMDDTSTTTVGGIEAPVANPNSLNPTQKLIYDRFKRYFHHKKEFLEGKAHQQPDPIQELIHGGPGKK